MSWTSPPTFVAGAILTAAQMNVLGGDISLLGGTADNLIATAQTTATTTYTDLATVGPVVTLTTGANALVCVTCALTNANAVTNWMGFQVSGATTLAATDALVFFNTATATYQLSAMVAVSLNAGSNTFTAKYKVNGGTTTFSQRRVIVIPRP